MADTSVEIKTDKIPAYLKLTKITVNDNEIKANSDGKYIFTMPKKMMLRWMLILSLCLKKIL